MCFTLMLRPEILQVWPLEGDKIIACSWLTMATHGAELPVTRQRHSSGVAPFWSFVPSSSLCEGESSTSKEKTVAPAALSIFAEGRLRLPTGVLRCRVVSHDGQLKLHAVGELVGHDFRHL
jgi:hypothetical protein